MCPDASSFSSVRSGPPPIGRTHPVRTTTRQHSHPAPDRRETAGRVGRTEGPFRPCDGTAEYETRHVRSSAARRSARGRTRQVASASKGGRSSSSGFLVMSTRPPDEEDEPEEGEPEED